MLDQFRRSWPDVDVDIRQRLAFTALPALAREEVDLVISSDDALFGHPSFRYYGWGPRMWTWIQMMGLRKFQEMVLAFWFETWLSKNEILSRYLSTIYFGDEGLKNALLVQKQIPGSKLWNDARGGESVQLVLGYGFEKLVDEPDPPLPAPAEISVNVYNTTWKEGLAAEASAALEDREFTVKKTGNDPQNSFHKNEVGVIRFGPEGERAAKRLAEQVEDIQMQKDDRSGTTLDLTSLGSPANTSLTATWQGSAAAPVEIPVSAGMTGEVRSAG